MLRQTRRFYGLRRRHSRPPWRFPPGGWKVDTTPAAGIPQRFHTVLRDRVETRAGDLGDEAMAEIFVLISKLELDKVKVIICPHDFRKNEKYPVIPQINWSEELYDNLKKELGL